MFNKFNIYMYSINGLEESIFWLIENMRLIQILHRITDLYDDKNMPVFPYPVSFIQWCI